MRLPDRSVALVNAILAVRPDAVTCNQSGTPVELNFDTEPRTLVHFFYNGNEVGAGLADVLFGKVSPSAKLPYTWPKTLRDVAAHRDESTFPGVHQTVCRDASAGDMGAEIQVRYDEGCFVGYRRRHRDTQPKVLFPFGHGLRLVRCLQFFLIKWPLLSRQLHHIRIRPLVAQCRPCHSFICLSFRSQHRSTRRTRGRAILHHHAERKDRKTYAGAGGVRQDGITAAGGGRGSRGEYQQGCLRSVG